MRVITEEKLQTALFAELQRIAVDRNCAHFGMSKHWCLQGAEVDKAIRNIFADDSPFRVTEDIDTPSPHGKWEICLDEAGYEYGVCPACGFEERNSFPVCYTPKHCPECGVKIEGRDDDR